MESLTTNSDRILLSFSVGAERGISISTERLADGSGSDGGREVAERGEAAQLSCRGLDAGVEIGSQLRVRQS